MNDPRITAYALGELAGTERDDFERDLATSETLQAQLNETIKIAEALGTLTMSTDTLTEKSRTDLQRQLAANQKTLRRKKTIIRLVITGSALAAAACVVFSLSMPAITGSLTRREVAAVPAELQQDTKTQPESLSQTSAMDTDLLKKEAKELLTQGRFEASDQRYSNVLARTPNDTEAQEGLRLGAEARAKFAQTASSLTSNATATAGASTAWETPVRRFTPSQTTAPARIAKQDFVQDARRREQRFDDSGRLTRTRGDFNTETYDSITENVFLAADTNPLSTFSIDVDTASYANVRRFLQSDQLPPVGAIRTEELINYFSYAYPQPKGNVPFSVSLEVSRAPWDAKRELVRIGLKGREIPASERGPANLVFLIDVSGSMNSPDKLPLLKRSLQALVENLSPKDRVAIAVYAGSSGLVLPSTPGTEKTHILEALENLQAGGSTNGASGIKLAYETAREHFLKEGNNRVILCTDGDFNVGVTDQSELIRLIEKERTSNVFLSVLGFGTGNLKDSTMEKLADKGNGNYAYIDSFTEGRKVLVEQMGSTLFTIAKDVKIQVEFNPARVAGYRLIGYENRLLAKEDFNNDKKDAGEIGAGHTVTALYEIIPAGQPLPDQPSVDPLKYQTPEPTAESPQSAIRNPQSQDLLTVKLRYKAPDGDKSQLLEVPLAAPAIPAFDEASSDFQFATAVAAFGMKLRNSPTAGNITWPEIQKIARTNLGEDPGSYRAEFLTLIEKAARLTPPEPAQ